jgi:hypothetical protein
MSSTRVKLFLEKKNAIEKQKKDKDLAQLKYEILSHYKLGESISYDENVDKNEFPLIDSRGNKFKYVCDVSEEDFEKIKEIYDKENPKSTDDEIKDGTGIKDSAEKTLNTCAVILLILGIIVFIAMWVAAADDYDFNWSLFGIGAGVFFTSLIEFAFAKVLVNISRKLNKLG